MRENQKDAGPKIVKNKKLDFFKKATVYVLAFSFISFLSVRSYSVEPYDAIYNDGLLTIPKILVPAIQDIFRVEMELDAGAQALALGCSEYCFRLVNAESSSVKSPPFFPNFDGVFANINRLWVDDQLYEISLRLLGEVTGQIYFGLHFADHPKPFQSTPLVLSDELARPYYNHACQLEQKARKLPFIQFAIPVDINQDDYLDFIVVYYCPLDGPYWGELQEYQTPDVLVAFVSDSVGNYSVQNELVFGELYPSLGGGSRKYVVGDINQDGVDDLAFAMHWEDGRGAGDDRMNMSNAAYPALILSQSKGRYQVYKLGERSWGHAVDLVPNAAGGIDAVFAGFWGKNLQAFRYVQDTFQDVTDEYPPPNMNTGWAMAFRALLPGTDNYSFGKQVVGNSAYSPNLDTGLTLWRETASGWEISSEFLIKAGPKISGISWQKTPTEWTIQELNGKEYVSGGFSEICVMENFDQTGESYVVGKFSGNRFAEPVDFSRVYDEGDLLPTNVMVFFSGG